MIKHPTFLGFAAILLTAAAAPIALAETNQNPATPDVTAESSSADKTAMVDDKTTVVAADDKAEEDVAVDDKKREKVVCKTSRVVNSRIPQRVCMMQWQWDEQKQAQIQNREQNRNRNSSCGASIRC